MDKKELEKEAYRSMNEFNSAWEEFFKDKQEPKNEEEDKKQQEDFYNWYNYVRKQTDTGKTPAEMYKEIYGEEPKNNFNEKNPSRFMNFEWDEDYNEEDFDDEDEKELNELTNLADSMFDKGVWQNSKEQMKDMSKKDSSKHMFRLGFFMHYKYMNEQLNTVTKEFKNMSEEEMKTFIKNLKDDK